MSALVPRQALSKLRTYKDDLARAQKARGVPDVVVPPPSPTPAAPQAVPQKIVIPNRVRTPVKAASPEPRTPQPLTISSSSIKPVVTTPAPLPKTPVHTSAPVPPHRDVVQSGMKVDRRIPAPFVAEDLEKIKSVEKASILSGDEHAFEVHAGTHATDGSIVTDTMRKRFKLFPAIVAAFKSWLFVQKERYDEHTRPKFTVAPAEKRKDVIERAATAGALAPKDDHTEVVSRLRHVPRTRSVAEVTIKKAEKVPAPTWTHVRSETTEPVETQKQEAKVEPLNREPSREPLPSVKISTSDRVATTPVITIPPAPVPVTPLVPKPEIQDTPPVIQPTKVTKPPVASQPVVPPNTVSTHTPPPAPLTPPALQGVPAITQAPVRASETNQPARTVPRTPAPRPAFTQRPSARPSFYPLLLAGVVASAFGILGTVWFFSGNENERLPEMETPSFITADTRTDIALGSKRTELLSNIQNAMSQSGMMAITELRPMLVTENDTRPATPAEIVSVFNPRAPGGFTRAITGITFGSYRGSEPFIVLKTTSYDAALGGMLLWEENMSADLAPLFGDTVRSTFDPTARTATQTREPFFVDIVHANRDMRVLRDEAGDERIMYSFLDRTTILISTDRTVIEEIAPLVH